MNEDEFRKTQLKFMENMNASFEESKAELDKAKEQGFEILPREQHYEIKLYLTRKEIALVLTTLETTKEFNEKNFPSKNRPTPATRGAKSET